MNSIKFIIACCATLFLLLSNQLFAAQCSTVFPDVIATHGNGNSQISFGYNAHLINNPDSELFTRQVSHNPGSNINSCGSADCTASNSSAESVSVNFRRGNGSVDYNPPSDVTTTFGIRGTNNYRNISAQSNAIMQFGDAYDIYFFENLSLGFNNTLNLAAGKTYYFRALNVGSSVSINVIGSGTAKVFVDAGVNFTSPTMINSPSENRSGDVSKLVMHVKGNVTFGSRSTFSGALYAEDITFTSASYLFGVASGERIALNSRSVLTYDNTVFGADFGEVCDSSSPAAAVVNYQFDECKYTGAGNEVLDQLENFNASASSGVSSSSSSIVNRSLDLSATGTGDWVTIPNDAIDGLNDFSISVWINTSASKRQQEIFQALGSSASDDEVELYLIDSSTLNIKLKDRGKNFSIGRSVTNGQWHHLVVTRIQNDVCLYVNGSIQDCDDGFPNRSLSVPNSNAVVLGQEQDRFGGRFNSRQSFEGKLDELIIFDGALTADEVITIYDNQNSGKNYDGSSRDAVSCVSVMANFQFDECSYTGAGNEVIDQLGSYSGTSHNNVNTTDFGQIDNALNMVSAPHHVQVSIPLPTTYSVSTWFKKPDSNSGSRYFVFGAMENGGDLLLLDRTRSMRWAVYQPDQGNVYGTYSFATLDANWHHMVLVYQGNTTSLYIDGNFIETVNLAPTGTLKYIGTSFDDVNGFNPQGFRSPLDEFIVFNGALTANNITAIYDYQNLSKNYDGSARQASACRRIHHYEIVHDGNGLTCAVEPITVKACTNSDCSSNDDLSTESVSIDFTVTDPAGTNIIKASPTFTGSTSFTFNHVVAEALTLSISGATVTASDAVECSGVGDSCVMNFANAGFRFLSGDDNNETIAHQTAGIEFSKTLKLQAVKSNNGVCEGLFTGAVKVSLAQENITPELSFNPGLAFQSAGSNIAKHPQFTDNVTLDFAADSIAIIPTPKYLDAGQIRLHAKYANDEIAIVGSSNNFWVKPDKFLIDSSARYNALTDSTFVAGQDFSFNVRALNSQGAATQNYRQSDGPLQLQVLQIAPVNTGTVKGKFSYAKDLNVETSSTFQPVTLTSFSVNDNEKGTSIFSGGQYNEVGIINIDVQANSYGGLTGTEGLISADDLTLGRFIPAYFKQTVNTAGTLDAYHSEANSRLCEIADWTYTGQRTTDNNGTISYSLEPKIAITAFNAQNKITKNYTLGAPEGYMKLLAAGVKVTSPNHDDEQLRVNDEELSVDENAINFVEITSFMAVGTLDFSVNEGELVAGQMLYKFSDNDHFSYERDDSSFLQPFSAKIPFVTEQITDQDGVTLQTETTSNEIAEGAIEKLISKGVEVRFARLVLENSYGSENSPLRSPLSVEVYGATGFTVHADEVCLSTELKEKKSGLKYSGNMNLWDYRLIDIDTDAIEIADTTASVTGVLDKGIQKQLFFTAPGKQGTLEWEYNVPAWFKFKWDALDGGADGNFYDDNPSAILNFGLYRGNDRIISWREISN